jgi:hypothetical protein
LKLSGKLGSSRNRESQWYSESLHAPQTVVDAWAEISVVINPDISWLISVKAEF